MQPVQRFETPPGHQGQVDFADFRLPWGKRHALIVVLGYSRRMWLRFYERQTMAVVMEGLESAFRYFGGVPSELLFDQMKAVIVEDNREVGGRRMENTEFLRYAYGPRGFRADVVAVERGAPVPDQRVAHDLQLGEVAPDPRHRPGRAQVEQPRPPSAQVCGQ